MAEGGGCQGATQPDTHCVQEEGHLQRAVQQVL